MKKTRRTLAVVLVLALALGLLSAGMITAFAADKEIKNIALTGVVEPKIGAYADYTSPSLPEGLEYLDVWAYDFIELETSTRMYEKYFKVDKTYQVSFRIGAIDGYKLADAVTVTINGKPATVKKVSYYLEISYTFQKLTNKEIKNIAITGVVEPKIGSKADYTKPVLPEGLVYLDTDAYKWTEVGTKESMDHYAKFCKDGESYEVFLRIGADDGYVLVDAVTVTINGKPATVKKVSYYLEVTYIFPKLTSKEISNIAITGVVEPKIGTYADYKNPALPEGLVYLDTDAYKWTEVGTKESMDQAGKYYKEGESYEVFLRIGADDGYKLADSVTATINGKPATVTKESYYILVTYIFPELKEGAEDDAVKSVSITVIKPVAGAASSDSVSSDAAGKIMVLSLDWYDVVDGSPVLMELGDVFEKGHTYRVSLHLQPKEDGEFADDAKVNINGAPASIESQNKGQITCYYDFKVEEKEEGKEPGAYVFPFTDVADSAWYRIDVEIAHKSKLIDGKTTTLYMPDDNMTVAEAVKLAACMHQLYHEGKVTLTNGSPWYSSYIEYAVDNGIIEMDVSAEANDMIDRFSFVNIFYNALPVSEYAAMNAVADDAIPDVKFATGGVVAPKIYAFYRAGILIGSDEQGTFHPSSNIKRSEVAAILTRMFDATTRKPIKL